MRKRDLIVGLGAMAALAACGRQEEKAETPATDSPPVRAITDPAPVVRQLYDPYLVAEGGALALLDAAPWSAQMRADLEAMMARSQALGEPILDFDPLINAQDYQLSNVATATEALVEASHASVRASFQNGDRRDEVVYDLVWEDDRWKVDNVRGPEWELRTIARGS